jgi:hypothetical protein
MDFQIRAPSGTTTSWQNMSFVSQTGTCSTSCVEETWQGSYTWCPEEGGYDIRVRAYAQDGGTYGWETSAWSNNIYYCVNAPSNLQATVQYDQPLSSGRGKIVLTWTDNSNIEQGFKIERQALGGSWTQIATVGANVTTYTDTSINDNTYYSYRVRAYYGSYNSNYSNTASTTTRDRSNPTEPKLNVITNGLVAYWPLDENAGTTAIDYANNYDGTLQGDASWSTQGRFGNALNLDGSSDYVAINNLVYNTAGQISEITVCAWVKSSSTSQQIIASFDRSEYWRLALVDDTGTGNVGWDTHDSAGTTHDLGTTLSYTDGSWHFICGWFKAGATPDKKIYVDGNVVAQANAHNGNNLGSGVTRYGFIGVGSEASSFNGTTGPNLWFNGLIDEVAIYDRALTDEEISYLYTNSIKANQVKATWLVSSDESPSIEAFKQQINTPNNTGGGVLATDGTYLYVKRWGSYEGQTDFRKFGSGYNGTTAGQDFGTIENCSANNTISATYIPGGYILNGYTSNGSNIQRINIATGACDYLTVDSPLMNRCSGADLTSAYSALLITSNGKYIFNLAYDDDCSGYNQWKIKMYTLDGKLVATFTQAASAFYTDGIIADDQYIYAIKWRGKVRRFKINPLGADQKEWDFYQNNGNMINGQYDWVNNTIWLSHLYADYIKEYRVPRYGLYRATGVNGEYNPVGGVYNSGLINTSTTLTLASDVNDFVLEFMARDTTSGDGEMWEVQYRYSGTTRYITDRTSTTTVRLQGTACGGTQQAFTSNVSVGEWEYIKIVKRYDKLKLYQNEKFIGEATLQNCVPVINEIRLLAGNGIEYKEVMLTPLVDDDEYTDSSATDQNAPALPGTFDVVAIDPVTIRVTWSATEDQGTTYYYQLSGFDEAGNESSLLYDGSFEKSVEQGYWKSGSLIQNGYSFDTSTVFSGNYSLKQVTTDGPDCENRTGWDNCNKYFGSDFVIGTDIDASSTYELSCMVKTALTTGYARLMVEQNGTVLSYDTVNGSTDWTKIRTLFTTASSGTVRLLTYTIDGTGTTYWDKCELRKVVKATVISGLHNTAFYVEETTGNQGGTASGWIAGNQYIDEDLLANTQYCYRIKVRDAQGNESAFSSPVCVNTSKISWRFITLRYDPSNNSLELYINGDLKDTNTLSGTINTNNQNLIIGQDFNGFIDAPKIYARTLSETDIIKEYLDAVPILAVGVTSPNGGETITGVTYIDFNVKSPDSNTLTVDLNYSTSRTVGTGTVIASGLSTDSASIVCDDYDFSDNTHCRYEWDARNVTAGTYYIIVRVNDGTNTASDASNRSFTVS